MSNQEKIELKTETKKRNEQLLLVFNNRTDAPKALKYCDEWLSIKGNENDLFFLAHKAEALKNLSKTIESQKYIDKVLGIEPFTGDDYFSYVRVNSMSGNFETAYQFALDGHQKFDHVICLTYLAWAHKHGKGCNVDNDLCLKYYQLACEKNAPPIAHYNFGIELRNLGREDEAIKYFMSSALNGYPSAFTILINHFDKQNESEDAFKFYKILEDLGKIDQPKIYYSLGLAYFYGKHVQRDLSGARKYFQTASDMGHFESKASIKFFDENSF